MQQLEQQKPVYAGFKLKKRPSALPIARAAVVAATYFLLTFFTGASVSYGPIQLRLGEAMTLLPILMPEAAVGLSIGCLLANILSPFGWYDMVFGTLATVIASFLTLFIAKALPDKKWMPLLAAVPPVLINAIILPLVWFAFGVDTAYYINLLSIFATQTAMVYALGLPLYKALSTVVVRGKTTNK